MLFGLVIVVLNVVGEVCVISTVVMALDKSFPVLDEVVVNWKDLVVVLLL